MRPGLISPGKSGIALYVPHVAVRASMRPGLISPGKSARARSSASASPCSFNRAVAN